jgi:branched-chain amino acid transport system permease protein
MEQFLSATIFGLYLGSAYSIAASGLVLTYTTTRVFNLAHGATAMLMAFVYWQLHVDAGVPTWLSILLVLFVIAPLFGIVLERVVMRGLGDAPVSVSLVVTVAVFMLLVGVAIQLWPNDQSRYVSYFFGYDGVALVGINVQYHFLITIAVAAAVAGALYVLLNRTRIGTAMRAAVDNPELMRLFGASSERISMLSWACGSTLAALGGVMLVAYTGLDYYILTFLVIASFAAAMLGRLRSLPLTFLGSIALGLGTAYVQSYVHGSAYLQTGLQSSLPTFMLFATLIFVPQVRLRVGQVKGILAATVPSSRQSVLSAAGMVAASVVLLQFLNLTNTTRFGDAVIFGIVMLSLMLLTGYGGYVSLAQFTFVGVGAAVVAKMHTSSPLAIVMAVVIAAAVGALVSLPVLRLTGLYLALATLAFARLMEKLVFQADFMFGYGGTLKAERLALFGYDFGSNAAYVALAVVVFVLVGLGLLAVRRGAIGRLLIALRDSPAACGTLGLNQRWFRVAVFSASAGIAGLAGALYAGLHTFADPNQFATLQNLPLLLCAVVAGVTTVSGAFLGGLLLMLIPVIQATEPKLSGLVFMVIAVGALLLGKDPNGLINQVFRATHGTRTVTPRLPLPHWLSTAPARVAVGNDAADDSPAEPAREGQVIGRGVA